MKPNRPLRRVFVLLELDTDRPLDELRDKSAWGDALNVNGGGTPSSTCEVVQVQANVHTDRERREQAQRQTGRRRGAADWLWIAVAAFAVVAIMWACSTPLGSISATVPAPVGYEEQVRPPADSTAPPAAVTWTLPADVPNEPWYAPACAAVAAIASSYVLNRHRNTTRRRAISDATMPPTPKEAPAPYCPRTLPPQEAEGLGP